MVLRAAFGAVPRGDRYYSSAPRSVLVTPFPGGSGSTPHRPRTVRRVTSETTAVPTPRGTHALSDHLHRRAGDRLRPRGQGRPGPLRADRGPRPEDRAQPR